MAEYPAVGFAAFVNGLSEGAKSSIDILKGINELKQLRAQWEAADADPRLKGKDGGDGYFGSGGDYGSRGDMSDSGSSTGRTGGGGGAGSIVSNNTADNTLPNEARAFLDSLAGPESQGAYNAKYPGTTFDPGDTWQHPGDPQIIKDGPYAGQKSDAAGRYQFLGSTWRETVAAHPELNLTDFSPGNQDKAAWALAQDKYKASTGRDLLTDLQAGDLSKVPTALKGTWPTINAALPSYAQHVQKYANLVPTETAIPPKEGDVRPWETEGKTPPGTPASAAVPMPAYEPETAPPQAIGAPKPPDEVQSSQYTAPRSTVQPASYAGSGPAIVGDSIAGGFHVAAGGNPRDIPNDPSNTTAPVVNGRGPMNTLAYLHSLPDNYFQGRQVIFSGGASNNPGEIAAAYPAAMDEFKRLGASGVHVVGVGMQPGYEGDRYHDLNQHNKTIQQIAEKGGARFTGGLPAVVHPARGYYAPVYQRLRQGQPQAAIGADQQSQYAGLIPDSTTGSSLYGGYA